MHQEMSAAALILVPGSAVDWACHIFGRNQDDYRRLRWWQGLANAACARRGYPRVKVCFDHMTDGLTGGILGDQRYQAVLGDMYSEAGPRLYRLYLKGRYLNAPMYGNRCRLEEDGC